MEQAKKINLAVSLDLIEIVQTGDATNASRKGRITEPRTWSG
jgi:hypothetical protein